MSKVWVTSTVDWDQRTIEAVFSTQELADAFIKVGGANSVKGFEIDEHAEIAKRGLRQFCCEMRRDNWKIRIRPIDLFATQGDKVRVLDIRRYDDEGYPHAEVDIWAKDEDDAERIAVHRRAQWLADEIRAATP